MKEKYSFIDIIREKPGPIAAWTLGLTFLIGKIIEFIINWLLNLGYSGYGPRTQMPITIFYPIIFIFVGIKVVKRFKRQLDGSVNTEIAGEVDVKNVIKPDYYGNYTWKDIFRDREVFSFFVVLVLLFYCVFFYGLQFISSLSSNYAIMSLGFMSTDTLVILSIIAAALLVVWLMNTVISWLSKTQKGNKVLSIVVFLLGVLTVIGMLGISYLWEDPETIEESFATDFMMGMIFTIDLTTTAYAIVTAWFWNKARKCKWINRKQINTGLLLAIVSFIVSLTPLQTAIQMIWVMIVRGISL